MVIPMRPLITRRSVLRWSSCSRTARWIRCIAVIHFSFPILRTGSHVNDTRLIRPIFFDDQVVAFACTVIHWADMGGPMPGTFDPEATTCYAEGIRIRRSAYFKRDVLDEELFHLIAINVRRPSSGARPPGTGRGLEARRPPRHELCERYGVETLLSAFEEQFFNYSERVMLAELEQMPDGTWDFEDFGDQDVMTAGKPPIRVHCT